MLFVEIENLEFPGGHIEIMLFIEMEKIELISGHIEIMLYLEIENLEFLGGHNEIMFFLEIEKSRISPRPYWNCAIYRDGKTTIKRRPY